MSANSTAFPLTFAERRTRVSLVEIRAGDKLRQRLSDLGLNIGMCIRVVQDESCGAHILDSASDGRLAIGHAMAQKIMVQYAHGEA